MNELRNITASTGSTWATPTYDRNRNMGGIPQTINPTLLLGGTYDAWNRLVKLSEPPASAGGDPTPVAEYEYDGRNYRIVTKSYVDNTLDETRHTYYTNGWQAIEERINSETTPERQFVWGLRYIDDLILRDRTTSSELDERLYALQDANWNVTAIVDSGGTVQERYEYAPYGITTVLTPAFSPLTSSEFSWETTYCGYRWEDAVGLFAVRFRWYAPRLATWVSRDPIGYAAGVNLYAYVMAMPVGFVDPWGLSPWGESGPYASQFSPSGPVLNPGVGKPVPTPKQLPPINIGKGSGDFYFTSHELQFVIPTCGRTREEVKAELISHLQQFDLFNAGQNTVATVHLSSDRTMATFDMSGFVGQGADQIGNADAVPVGLSYIADEGIVRADTREGHMLEGVRIWTAHVNSGGGPGYYRVTLYTSAIDRKVGAINRFGAWLSGTKEQEKIWDQYLHNIADAYQGSRRELHHDRYKAKRGINPFESYLPDECTKEPDPSQCTPIENSEAASQGRR